MTEIPITISDVAALSGIAASVASIIFAVVFQGGKLLMAFLTAKFGTPPMTRAEQSAQCRFDHSTLHGLIAQQNSHIEKMLEQNQVMIRSMSEANHAAELRSAAAMAKLELISERIKKV
jgi:hypothetical protein